MKGKSIRFFGVLNFLILLRNQIKKEKKLIWKEIWPRREKQQVTSLIKKNRP